MTEDNSDIINLPHHVSHNHPQMPMMARAAQFAPFAALTGYDAVIHETARLTDRQVELEEYDNERLNRIFSELMNSLTGQLKKVDTYEQLMVMENGTAIPIGNIMDLQF